MDSFKDNRPTYKKSTRPTNWRLFLAKYTTNMEIRHRFGKSHANADTLSRLQTADPVPVTPEQTRQLCTDTKGGLTPTKVFCLPIHSEELPRLTGVFDPRLASLIGSTSRRTSWSSMERKRGFTYIISLTSALKTRIRDKLKAAGFGIRYQCR